MSPHVLGRVGRLERGGGKGGDDYVGGGICQLAIYSSVGPSRHP